MMQAEAQSHLKDTLDKLFSEFVNDLKALIRIPSVSAHKESYSDLKRSASLTFDILKKSGFEDVRFLNVDHAPPYVFASYMVDKKLPTVLLYAHYDVQPQMREILWETPPYEPHEKRGRLYGRGSADDKAGIMIHAGALRLILNSGFKPACNIKVIIDGEEETGCPHIENLLCEYRQTLSADAVIIADVSHYDSGIPSVTTSLRGIAEFQLTLKTMDHPLHSGMWGGPIPDAPLLMSRILSSLIDESGKILVPGIYDDVTGLSDEEVKSYKALGINASLFKKQSGVFENLELYGDGEEILKQMWRLPALSVKMLEAGTAESAGNVCHNEVKAKVGLRLAPGMNPGKTVSQVKDYLSKQVPPGVFFKVNCPVSAPGWRTDVSHPVFQIFGSCLKEAYGKDPVFIGSGGSIPFVKTFTEGLGGIPALLTAVEDPYTNAHGENESLLLSDFKNALLSQAFFLYRGFHLFS